MEQLFKLPLFAVVKTENGFETFVLNADESRRQRLVPSGIVPEWIIKKISRKIKMPGHFANDIQCHVVGAIQPVTHGVRCPAGDFGDVGLLQAMYAHDQTKDQDFFLLVGIDLFIAQKINPVRRLLFCASLFQGPCFRTMVMTSEMVSADQQISSAIKLVDECRQTVKLSSIAAAAMDQVLGLLLQAHRNIHLQGLSQDKEAAANS